MSKEKCERCGQAVKGLTILDGVCSACNMDWEWFMSLRVVDLEHHESGRWSAPDPNVNGSRVFIAETTEELRALIRLQPIGRDRGGAK